MESRYGTIGRGGWCELACSRQAASQEDERRWHFGYELVLCRRRRGRLCCMAWHGNGMALAWQSSTQAKAPPPAWATWKSHPRNPSTHPSVATGASTACPPSRHPSRQPAPASKHQEGGSLSRTGTGLDGHGHYDRLTDQKLLQKKRAGGTSKGPSRRSIFFRSRASEA